MQRRPVRDICDSACHVGAGASAIVFQEKFGALRLAGMATVIGGIAIMLLSKRPKAVPKIA